jgi:hypothetical protein
MARPGRLDREIFSISTFLNSSPTNASPASIQKSDHAFHFERQWFRAFGGPKRYEGLAQKVS